MTARTGRAPFAGDAHDSIATQPPHNLDAEEHVLGAMLLSAKVIEDVSEILAPEAFYRDSHRIIYRRSSSFTEPTAPSTRSC